MRSFHIEQFGAPSGLVMCKGNIPKPGKGEVLIRLWASSLNFRDGMILGGALGHAAAKGIVPLSDAAGEVIGIGEEVRDIKVGDRVMPIFNRHWLGGLRPTDPLKLLGLGGDGDGTLRDYIVSREDALVRIPDHLSYEEAACLPCAAVTAWSGLVQEKPLYPGEIVLTQGTGGVSIFALQLAKLFGARVISTTSSEEKAQRLIKLGADAVVNYRTHPEWDVEVRKHTRGRGVDVVVEVGGAGTLGRSFRCTHPNSRIGIVGLLSGAKGGDAFDYTSWTAATYRTGVGSKQDFERMNLAIGYHRMRPVIDKVFDFADAPAAFEHLLAQRHFGKVVISHK